MATNTPNLNLVLPDYSDKADVGVINDNFRKIDNFSGGGKVEEWLDDIQEKADESLSEIENKANAFFESIPDDYETIYNDVSALKDTKADAIRDTSAKAASHTLHAQSGPMSVTLHGKTTEKGSGDKSPENPYTISGVDAAMVQASGKNLCEIETVSFVQQRLVDLSTPIPAGTYTVSALVTSTGTDSNESRMGFYDEAQQNFVGAKLARGARSNATVTLPFDAVKVLFYAEVFHGESEGDEATYADIQIEHGSVATPYEPYTANVINPPLLPDGKPLMDAEKVENDVLSGCDKCIELNGTESWSMDSKGCGYIQCDDLVRSIDYRDVIFSDKLHNAQNHNSETTTDFITGYGSNTGYPGQNWIYVRIAGVSSKAELKEYLAANPLKVYYRSTAYTPGKDLRACRVTRRWETVTLDGSEDENWYQQSETTHQITLKKAPMYSHKNQMCNGLDFAEDHPSVPNRFRINTSGALFVVTEKAFAGWQEFMDYISENPLTFVYELATPEVYMTDRHELRKPDGLPDDDTTVVTGSGETVVEYLHKIKHFIIDFVTKALASQS